MTKIAFRPMVANSASRIGTAPQQSVVKAEVMRSVCGFPAAYRCGSLLSEFITSYEKLRRSGGTFSRSLPSNRRNKKQDHREFEYAGVNRKTTWRRLTLI
jgi:hypothetical protein